MLSTWSSLVTQRGSPNQTQNQPQLSLSLTNMETCTCDFTQVEEQSTQIKKTQSSNPVYNSFFKQLIQAQFSILTVCFYISTYPLFMVIYFTLSSSNSKQ